MTSRVLIADDSLTIQKVIGITLAHEPYELVCASSEEELFSELKSNKFDLILLDFTLSDTKSGYDLSTKIQEIISEASIMMMFGTFDSIEDDRLKESGAQDRIIKPFESEMFIQKCRRLIHSDNSISDIPEMKVSLSEAVEEANSIEDNVEKWSVDTLNNDIKTAYKKSVREEAFVAFDEEEESSENKLNDDLEGWGMAIPDVIEGESFTETSLLKDNIIFPPVMDEEDNGHVKSSFEEDIESVNDMNEENTADQDLEVEVVEDIEEAKKIEEHFLANLPKNELSNISKDDFWSVDDDQDSDNSFVVESDTEFLDDEVVPEVDPNEILQKKETIKSIVEGNLDKVEEIVPQNNNFDEEAMIERLQEKLLPMMEEMIQKICREKIEKVAWDVIPDLAENLIRKEIKEIAESVK